MTAQPEKRAVSGYIPDPADWDYHQRPHVHGSYHAVDHVEREVAPRQPIGFHIPGRKPVYRVRAVCVPSSISEFPRVG